MTEAEAYAFLGVVFQHVFRRADIALSPELTAKDVVGWDSIAHVDLLMEIEDRLHFAMQSDEIDALRTVGDLAALICRKSAAAAGPTGVPD